ncbi:YigZ family protein [Rhodocaloribacter litoris]|uniref:IMPACT family protein n=1 Tax=Rhodocaloribacter litoris TaxID=2558931 RepID=UPI00141E46F3|nr:YigZ family protein [Rhodocaloribacter litoris]QXD16105.1 YigZ family protein [Rhodocaloribacter litoris]GIV59839.1 MAG: hypothetical protein KatS3mg043_0928 [Rhodothermaceae bacterium]
MKDIYRVLRGPARVETRVRGSRFIAEALPVTDEAAAEAAVAAVRRREHGATHHCTAWRLGVDGTTVRYDDDGEPGGTAGPPILRQIQARDLTNTLVVVTRYFGGTKLGTGGLIRAYGEAAAAALDAAGVEERVCRLPVHLRFDYADTGPAMQVIGRFDVEVRASRYAGDTELIVGVRRSEVERFVEAFIEALRGRGDVTVPAG